ncbi:Uncharacterised protein [Vibrio cholerae]|nr:Uncharacterised protein [Vibrio cholerae]
MSLNVELGINTFWLSPNEKRLLSSSIMPITRKAMPRILNSSPILSWLVAAT